MKLKHKGKEYSVEEFGGLKLEEASRIVTEKLIEHEDHIKNIIKLCHVMNEKINIIKDMGRGR